MAKRRRHTDPGPAVLTESALAEHEGQRPDPADAEATARWHATRSARFAREVGGPDDPRRRLRQGAATAKTRGLEVNIYGAID